ncbi:MAG: SufD family Fe-S cluster assembly protein [Burkholderiaceae bacterium]
MQSEAANREPAVLQEVRDRWIPRQTELFRHLRPPEADTWLARPASSSDEASAWITDTPGDDAGQPGPRLAIETDREKLATALAKVPASLRDEYTPLAEAHAASCVGFANLRIGAEDEGRVIRIRRRSDAMRDAPLLLVEIAPGTRFTLVEDADAGTAPGIAAAMTRNALAFIRVGAGAHLRHLRIRREPPANAIANRTVVEVDGDGRYEQITIASGGDYHLERSEIDLLGKGAHAESVAVLLAAADRLEQQIEVRHSAPATRSRVETLVLAADAARVVVNSRTMLPREVSGAIVDQSLHGVPTAGQPKIILRPHLEILHDQVEARHGATWGALSEDALFYASQRGIDPDEARALIVDGMASALVDSCVDDPELLERTGLTPALLEAIAGHVGRKPERE